MRLLSSADFSKLFIFKNFFHEHYQSVQRLDQDLPSIGFRGGSRTSVKGLTETTFFIFMGY